MRYGMIAALLLGVAAAPALAEERDFCPERPGLDTPPCIVDKGRLQAELGLADWTLDRQPDSRTDEIDAGQIQLRYGVTDSTELRFGWTAYGHVRVRDRATGAVDRMSGTGDVTLGVKQSLLDPGGDKLSIALLPTVSLPSGGQAIGAGDWGASLALPASYPLSDIFQLELTPEVDAAVDADRSGRHLAYSVAGGLGAKLSKAWSVTGELQTSHDDDPSGHRSEHRAAFSAAYQFGKDFQIDAAAIAGLDHQTPDVEAYFGISHRF
ncbi:MAG: transporter [Sphingomonadaceae bacterium]|nr:transporter [Sphingomonadaceae bacterium]